MGADRASEGEQVAAGRKGESDYSSHLSQGQQMCRDAAPGNDRWTLVQWLRMWRDRPLDVRSPLDAPEAQRRLKTGLTSKRRALFGLDGAYVVVGRVSGRGVRLTAMAQGSGSNSWRPFARGKLLPQERGCRLVGTVGWAPSVRILSVIGLLGVSAMFVAGLGTLLASAAGVGLDWRAGIVLTSAAPVFIAFYILLSTVASRAASEDEAYLRAWLRETLEATEE